jgi:hypothetical protein
MFKLKTEIGQHKIFSYENDVFGLKEVFQRLYNYTDLENIHLISSDYEKYKDQVSDGVLSDRDTDLHRIFYDNIKTNDEFKKLYCNLIQSIYEQFFPEEPYEIIMVILHIRKII